MRYDVAKLISDMMSEAGVSDRIVDDLSNHSTISLNMKDDIPTIHIKNEDDEVWVWAQLCDYNPSALKYCSANLLELMFNYNEEIFHAGQPCLYPIDGNLELRAQIKEKYLESASDLIEVLDNFMLIMQEYRSVIM